jgi:WD40 repeat protein
MSGGLDNNLIIWSLQNCLPLFQLNSNSHILNFQCLGIFEEGLFLSTEYNCYIKISKFKDDSTIELKSLVNFNQYNQTGEYVKALKLLKCNMGLIVFGMFSGSLIICDVFQLEKKHSNSFHKKLIFCISELSNNRIATASADNLFLVWSVDLQNIICTHKFDGEKVFFIHNLQEYLASNLLIVLARKEIYVMDSTNYEIIMNCPNKHAIFKLNYLLNNPNYNFLMTSNDQRTLVSYLS